MRKPRRAARPGTEWLDDRCLPSGFTASQLTQAYGLNAISFTSSSGQSVVGNGAGETIALIEAYHDPNLASDLHVFDQANGLPDPSLSVVDQAGSQANGVWASEETLDVEWSHAIAPAANLLVVEAKSSTLANLMKAVDVARNTPGVCAVSMSWGFSESAGETAFDAHFQTPAGHQGITFIASSGDDGSTYGPEYPSASPRVLAVGGTTLVTGLNGDYLGEAPWSGSGGGYSKFESEPPYQDSVQSSGHRSTPDVAFLADPNTGVEVYETPPHQASGSWQVVGGTSLGSPAWAGLIAIADQGRALQGESSLDGPTQTLPTLYSLPSSDFHAVGSQLPESPWDSGLNLFGYIFNGWTMLRRPTRASETADTATGLGTPVGPNLIDGLVASHLTQPLTTGDRLRLQAAATRRSTGAIRPHLARPLVRLGRITPDAHPRRDP